MLSGGSHAVHVHNQGMFPVSSSLQIDYSIGNFNGTGSDGLQFFQIDVIGYIK